MNARQILINLHKHYNGHWGLIYAHIKEKKSLDNIKDYGDDKELITLVDPEYPSELKSQPRPAFVITKAQANLKDFVITFKVKVQAYNELDAAERAYDEVINIEPSSIERA